MLYRLLKIIIGVGIRLYYRTIKINNKELLDHNGPQIIIANHPNTLMDALIIGNVCSKPIHFMTKATFFNTPLKRRILSGLKMIPINRQVDSKTSGIKNEDSFESCYKILEQGKTLVIFPEGSSELERQLRQLKTGTARIALEAENRNNGLLNLRIVPLGLFYTQANSFQSSVLINVGKGICVTDYLDQYKENKTIAAKKLTENMRIQLERILFTADDEEQEKLIESLYIILGDKKMIQDVEYHASFMKHLKIAMEEIQLTRPYLISEVKELVEVIQWQSEKLAIHTGLISRRTRFRTMLIQISLSVVSLLVGLPLFLFGFIHNVFPYKLTGVLVPRFTPLITYYAALNVLTGLIVYPLTYACFLMIGTHVLLLSFPMKVLYFACMPLTGMFAFSFMGWYRKTGNKWKYAALIFNKKESLTELKNNHLKLESLIGLKKMDA